jgi:ATP-dependent Clp protease ATP-binding subunit ClpA
MHNEGADIEAIEKIFTPEFRNRLDAIIPFAPLKHDVIRLVVDKFIMQLDAQLADRNVEIELTEAALNWLGERGYDEKYGARPLARVVQEHIKKPLADELLFGALTGGGLAVVDVVDGRLNVQVKAPPPKALPGKRQSALPAPQAD